MRTIAVCLSLLAACSSAKSDATGAGGTTDTGAGATGGSGGAGAAGTGASSSAGGAAAGGASAGGTGGGQPGVCQTAGDCDDGDACTTDTCEAAVCVHASTMICAWPAESAAEATNLTEVGGAIECVLGFPLAPNDLSENLSGAVWNPMSQTLWLVKNNDPSLFAVVQDGTGFRYATQNGTEAAWEIPALGDVEGVTQVDFAEADIVYTVDEGQGTIRRVDASDYASVSITHAWGPLPGLGSEGAEGLTFVPDSFLTAQGFVDDNGSAYNSTKGMGGLMFVGHQSDGALHVFDLNPQDDTDYVYVGKYMTQGDETAGLELDRSTGVLHIWHDSSIDELELVSLSSTFDGVNRRMDTIVRYSGPPLTAEMGSNMEGIAVAPVTECTGGTRRLWIAIDGGDCYSLMMYSDFPC